MSSYRELKYIISGILVVLVVSISCNFPINQQLVPEDVIPVTTQAVEDLRNDIQESMQNLQSVGDFFMTISEEEITSLATFELEMLPDHPIQEPRIYLRDGQIQIAAILAQGSLLTPVQLILKVEIDSKGRPYYEIISGTLGPLPLPDLLREELKSRIDQILLERIYSQNTSIIIQSINISDGLMTIKGYTP